MHRAVAAVYAPQARTPVVKNEAPSYFCSGLHRKYDLLYLGHVCARPSAISAAAGDDKTN